MTSRRSFLSLLLAAPIAAPAMAKEQLVSLRGVAGFASLRPHYGAGAASAQLETLGISIDTTHLRATIQHEIDVMVRAAQAVVRNAHLASVNDDPHDPVPAEFDL